MPKSKNLKYCRKRAGLTQQQFADIIGVTKQTVISWEAKKTAIPVPSTKRIAEYFGIDYAEFCDADLERLDRMAEEPLELEEQERQNILMFRQLPDHFKALVRYSIIAEYERMQNNKGVIHRD